MKNKLIELSFNDVFSNCKNNRLFEERYMGIDEKGVYFHILFSKYQDDNFDVFLTEFSMKYNIKGERISEKVTGDFTPDEVEILKLYMTPEEILEQFTHELVSDVLITDRKCNHSNRNTKHLRDRADFDNMEFQVCSFDLEQIEYTKDGIDYLIC